MKIKLTDEEKAKKAAEYREYLNNEAIKAILRIKRGIK